ncbi:MAG: type I restriction enzyme R subunit [Phenylobacterium sp.]|jgi:type I restriction enzyme R subunit
MTNPVPKTKVPKTKEEFSSKIPALKVIANLGWQYLSPEQCLNLRGNSREVVLRPVLQQVLAAHRFAYKNKRYPLTDDSINEIIKKLATPGINEGLSTANRRIYKDLTLGITVSEFINGKKHNVTVPIIHWDTQDSDKNQFHVTEEFPVAKPNSSHSSKKSRQPDIVCFVNGLPLVVIEAKKPGSNNPKDPQVIKGIEQNIRNQRSDEIPQLFAYSQLLMAISNIEARYATTGTEKKFWTTWQEEDFGEQHFSAIKNKPLSSQTQHDLFDRRHPEAQAYFADVWAKPELPNAQDRLLISLLDKSRFIELVHFYLLFDQKVGKVIARYPQFFAIQALIKRLCQRQPNGGREGGVLWHTTGSGKSFTMVFLCQVLLLHPQLKDCRILVVTDRTDLEKQLAKTFLTSGAFGTDIAGKKKGDSLAKVSSGRQLAKRIGPQGNERILFTIINKFNTAAKLAECYNPSDNIIVLVDEGHRSQEGENHERMRQVLPKASFIAFTGTPLLEKDKTRNKFGPIIHAYTMARAVEDGTVTPLLYEERQPELDINAKAIDSWFDKITAGLNSQQKTDLKRKYGRKGEIYTACNRIELIAWDIAIHFDENFKSQNLGLKAQLACDSKLSAIRYQQALEATGKVTSAIVMSPPDTLEGNSTTNENDLPQIQQWWKNNVTINAKEYEKQLIDSFAEDGAPDILIVVDKLLTGFDEPKNTVLYIDKPLQQHNLIQAIARVNRLHEQKEFGLLIDYRGILSALDTAIRDYKALADEGYDPDDIQKLYANINTEYKRLPMLNAQLHGLFSYVINTHDREQYYQRLATKLGPDEDGDEHDINQHAREKFYQYLTAFGMCLKTALASSAFYADESFDEDKIEQYKADLRFFTEVRQVVRQRSLEVVDYSAYEQQIRKLVDKQVVGNQIKEPDGVYVVNKLGQKIVKTDSPVKIRNETDTIRTRITHTIEQELADDPYAQKVLSELLKQAIAEAEALFDHPYEQYALFNQLEQKVNKREISDMPDELLKSLHAQAYYGVFKLVFGDDHFAQADRQETQKWVDEAFFIETIVNKAVIENSLNPQDIEAAISHALLPHYFKDSGTDKAYQIIEKVLNMTREGINKKNAKRKIR